MTAREGLYLVVIAGLGLCVARDLLALHRWVPGHFLSGWVVVRGSRPLLQIPGELPTPPVTTGYFYSASYHRVTPHQVLFTAPTFNGPCLLGVLEIPEGSSTVVMTARLQWSVYALFFVGFTIAGFPWLALLGLGTLFVINLIGDARACHTVLRLGECPALC